MPEGYVGNQPGHHQSCSGNVMQVELALIEKSAVSRLWTSMRIESTPAQTSAVLTHVCKSSGTTLPTLSWVTNHTATRKSGGHVISVQMGTCTAGLQLCIAGAADVGVLSAVAKRCASITPWLPRLPWLQLSGTMKQIQKHLMMWWHNASKSLVGTVLSVAASGVHHLTAASAEK